MIRRRVRVKPTQNLASRDLAINNNNNNDNSSNNDDNGNGNDNKITWVSPRRRTPRGIEVTGSKSAKLVDPGQAAGVEHQPINNTVRITASVEKRGILTIPVPVVSHKAEESSEISLLSSFLSLPLASARLGHL